MDGPSNEPESRRASVLGVIAVSAVVVGATGALLVFSWVRQSRLEGELSRARAMLAAARARLGPPAAEAANPGGETNEAADALEMLEGERREIARLERERAELERRSGELTRERADLERHIKRLQEEVDRLSREKLSGRPLGDEPDARASAAEEAGDILREHMRLMEETRALRDRLKVMMDAFEDLMLEGAARPAPSGAAGDAGPR